MIAAVERWNGSDQGRRGIIPNPSTFLNQERWKDTPPAAEPKKGELRFWEVTPKEKAQAQERAEFIDLTKKYPAKREEEIWP